MDETISNFEAKLEAEFVTICDSVKDKVINAKLLRGTKLDGVELRGGGEEFGERGHGELKSKPDVWPNKNPEVSKFMKFNSQFREISDVDKNTVCVSVLNTTSPAYDQDSLVAISGLQESNINGENRGPTSPYYIYVLMPTENAIHFTEMLSTRPDLLERFYSKEFDGLDSTIGSDVGLKRIKTDKLLIVNMDVIRSDPHDYHMDVKSIVSKSEVKILKTKVGVRD